ncbi:MAG: IS1380 family transposase [Planctomycetota bacterium]|nr:IS1380 family transposase [Planctomycetota bacterium]
MARDNRRVIDRIEVEAGDELLVAHAGLLAFVQWCVRKGILRLIAKRLPAAGSTGYPPEDMVLTLWVAMLLRGSRTVLETVDTLRRNAGLMALLGMKEMPSSTTMADWLRRLGEVELRGEERSGCADGLRKVQDLFYESAAQVLRELRGVVDRTLDFDAMCIAESKQYAEWMYTGERGTMSYLGFVGSVCVMAELEPGNHSPNDHIAERVRSCMDVCAKAGMPVRKLRSDAAGYTAGLFDLCEEKGRQVKYFVRARQDDAVQASERAIPSHEWTPWQVRMAHEKLRDAVLADTAHAMAKAKEGFRLVVERRQEEEADTEEQDGLLVRVPRVVTTHQAIATNDHSLSCADVLAFYNRRQGNDEQGNDKLKNDVMLGALPCRGAYGLPANCAYGYLAAMLHNVFEWYKHDCLGKEQMPLRLPTIVQRDFAVAARVTLHARTVTLTLASYARDAAAALQNSIDRIRRKVKRMAIPPVAPSFSPMIFRRA